MPCSAPLPRLWSRAKTEGPFARACESGVRSSHLITLAGLNTASAPISAPNLIHMGLDDADGHSVRMATDRSTEVDSGVGLMDESEGFQ